MEVKVNGKAFRGFDKITVMRNIDAIADVFVINTTTEQIGELPFAPLGFEDVVITDGGVVLVTGVVDLFGATRGAKGVTAQISGRSKTSPAIDSSVTASRHWSRRSIVDIATELLKPYGITVVANLPGAAPPPLVAATAQYGEPIGRFLQRLARAAGVLLRSTPQGALELFKADPAGKPRMRIDATTPGVLEVTHEARGDGRYSNYTISRVDDAGRVRSATAIDPAVRVPKSIVLGAETDTNSLDAAAEWARNSRRAGTKLVFGYDDIGTKPSGAFADGDIIDAAFPQLGAPRGRWIAKQVKLVESGNGRFAELQCCPVGAYE